MLSKKDKEWLETVIEEKIRAALTVKVRFEKKRDIKTGVPLAVPEIEIKDIYLPAHWIEFLPFYEASIRGVQETTDHVKNSLGKDDAALKSVAGILLGLEPAIKQIAGLSKLMQKALENKNLLLIE
jgi:hypothetical protein